MALQDILKKVLEDAAKKVTAIEAEAKIEVANIQKQIETTETEELTTLKEEHALALESIEEGTISTARREQKKFQLAAKCEVLEMALANFYTHLVELSDAEYEKVITALFAGINETGTIIVPTKRLEVSKKVAPKGSTVEGSEDIAGGFLFKTEAMTVDNSFKNVVYSEYKTTIEGFFAQKLELI